MDRISTGSGKFFKNMVLSGLLLTSSLGAMESCEQGTDASCPYHVTTHQGEVALGDLGIKPDAFAVHVTFPYRLLPRATLEAQNQKRPLGQDPLRNRDLIHVIDRNQTLTNSTVENSRIKVWSEMEHRLQSTQFDEDEKAGFKLGLAKLVMSSNFVASQRFNEATDCYNFVLNHLHYVIHSGKGVQQRKKAHARIWTALILTKRNIVIDGKTRQETLQQAWDLLNQAYEDSATDSTLFFQVELIVRYGLTPHGCSSEQAFELARQLCKKIGIRSHSSKELITGILKTKTPRSRSTKGDSTWRIARAAFIKDLKGEVEKIRSELFEQEGSSLDTFNQGTHADPFHEMTLIENTDEPEGADRPLQSDLGLEGQPEEVFGVEEELKKVKNLIDPMNPTMLRAFNTQDGGYKFFLEYDVSGFQNNCSFNCMNLTRQEALQSLLDNSDDEIVRQLVASQIIMHIVNQSMPAPLTDIFASVQVFDKIQLMSGKTIGESVEFTRNVLAHSSLTMKERAERGYERALQIARQFAISKNVFEAFVRYALAGNKMMEYQRNDEEELTSIMNALAYIHHFNLEIWTVSDLDGLLEQAPYYGPTLPTLQRVVSYLPQGATRIVRMHHMRRHVDGHDHFTYLIPYEQGSFAIMENSQNNIQIVRDLEILCEDSDERAVQEIIVDGADEIIIARDEAEPFVAEVKEKAVNEEKTKKRPRSAPSLHGPLSEETKQRIYQLHLQKKTHEYIAATCKIDCHVVTQILEQNFNIKRRKQTHLNQGQKEQIIRHFGGNIDQQHLTNLPLQKSAAQAANCSEQQVKKYLSRTLNGKPLPLNDAHKDMIEILAFNEKGLRTKRKLAEIARLLTAEFNRPFEIYQVMNHIRALIKTTKYSLR